MYARRMLDDSGRIEVFTTIDSGDELPDAGDWPPNFVLRPEHVNALVLALARYVDEPTRNALVVGWLRGPEGPPGPIGPMGLSA